MLGVAMPGIAPLRAGDPGRVPATERVPTPPTERGTPKPSPERARPRAPQAIVDREDEPPRRSAKRKGLPRSALILMSVAGALALVAGIVAFLWESPKPIRAEVMLDDRGGEILALTCDDCADGTEVSVGSNHATFASKKASLALAHNLQIGSNELAVDVKRPGIGRDEQVTLTVGVDYLVRGDLSALSADPPKVKVAVEALPARP